MHEFLSRKLDPDHVITGHVILAAFPISRLAKRLHSFVATGTYFDITEAVHFPLKGAEKRIAPICAQIMV